MKYFSSLIISTLILSAGLIITGWNSYNNICKLNETTRDLLQTTTYAYLDSRTCMSDSIVLSKLSTDSLCYIWNSCLQKAGIYVQSGIQLSFKPTNGKKQLLTGGKTDPHQIQQIICINYVNEQGELTVKPYIKYSFKTLFKYTASFWILPIVYLSIILLLCRKRIIHRHEIPSCPGTDNTNNDFRSSSFHYNHNSRELTIKDGPTIILRPQIATFLSLLLKAPDYTISKPETAKIFWSNDTYTAKENLRRIASDLRTIIRENSLPLKVISNKDQYILIIENKNKVE